jgi:hypothetical protein
MTLLQQSIHKPANLPQGAYSIAVQYSQQPPTNIGNMIIRGLLTVFWKAICLEFVLLTMPTFIALMISLILPGFTLLLLAAFVIEVVIIWIISSIINYYENGVNEERIFNLKRRPISLARGRQNEMV